VGEYFLRAEFLVLMEVQTPVVGASCLTS
ncbi:hypothetical protein A2U01_0088049, partial [Trifolium medium]|nr:hypothetical protein [Trifolium medium]